MQLDQAATRQARLQRQVRALARPSRTDGGQQYSQEMIDDLRDSMHGAHTTYRAAWPYPGREED